MVSRTASDLTGSNPFAKRQKVMPVGARSKGETAYYLANIGNATSIVAFVGNHRLFSYAMRAYGLEDRIYAKSLMIQILQNGVVENSTHEDPRFRAFATAFDFAGKGPGVTQSAAATTETTSLYIARAGKNDAVHAGTTIASLYVAATGAPPCAQTPVDPEQHSGVQNNMLGGM